jgi:hypothetical protein
MGTKSVLISPLYTNSGDHGKNGNGGGHGRPPFLITGRDIVRITNNEASRRDAIAAMLVRGEIQVVQPTVPQAAAIVLGTVHGTYDALHLSPRARALAAEIDDLIKTNGNGGTISPAVLDTLVRNHLADVWDAIERRIA